MSHNDGCPIKGCRVQKHMVRTQGTRIVLRGMMRVWQQRHVDSCASMLKPGVWLLGNGVVSRWAVMRGPSEDDGHLVISNEDGINNGVGWCGDCRRSESDSSVGR